MWFTVGLEIVFVVDKAQVEASFGLFGDSANRRKIGARFVPNVP
jgi:hypothetical protein